MDTSHITNTLSKILNLSYLMLKYKMEMNEALAEKFKELHEKIQNHELMKGTSVTKDLPVSQQMRPNANRVTLDDIERSIKQCRDSPTLRRKSSDEILEEQAKAKPVRLKSSKPLKKADPVFIKITLRKTPAILLYEQLSETALKDSEEGRAVEKDNLHYDELLVDKLRARRKIDAIIQTRDALCKSRGVNTISILKDHVSAYVSNFEMFDTYKDLQQTTKSVDLNDKQKMEITTYTVGGVDPFIKINQLPNFKVAAMLTMRALASNVFEKQQRRFRNMETPDPLAARVAYRYRLELLWRFIPEQKTEILAAVADLSFCPLNGDIIAAAYGIYSMTADKIPKSGFVCVWNIKNPVNAERYFYLDVPVVTVEFSPYNPQLLAIGLYDGSVQVRNISYHDAQPIAVSKCNTASNCEPVTAVRWMAKLEDDVGPHQFAPFLALSRDGSVTKYRIINSPHLLAFDLIQLDRVSGNPEGITAEQAREQCEANRHPQGLELSLHPLEADIFFILTDEGCLHKCSTFNPQHHLEVTQVHAAGANAMEYSPWAPKLYLTCGNDWLVYLWIEGITKPIITLENKFGPVHYASWSRTHSTIIVSVNRKSVDVWDISRSTLKPVSSTTIGNAFYTTFRFSLCGRSLAVGNENGEILMLAFEDMPFPVFYQYEALERAIYDAISNNKKLTEQVRSIGYLGYPGRGERKIKKKIRKRGRRLIDTI